MNWMWIIIGVLAGLLFMTKRNENNRIEAGDNRDREETETYTPVVRSMTGTGISGRSGKRSRPANGHWTACAPPRTA